MKKTLSILTIAFLFFSCGNSVKNYNVENRIVENSNEKEYVDELRGKTFTNYNNEYDILLTESFYFSPTGSVHFIEKVEGFPAETTYDNFKYELRGDTIEIYYDDNRKWKEEIRNTIFHEGKFCDTYLMLRNVHTGNNYEKYNLE